MLGSGVIGGTEVFGIFLDRYDIFFLSRAPGVHQRHTERSHRIGLTIGDAGDLREPHRAAKMADGRAEIAEIPFNQTFGLVRE